MLYGTAFRITNLLERSCSCDHLVLADSVTPLIERPSAIRLMSCAFGALFSMLPDVEVENHIVHLVPDQSTGLCTIYPFRPSQTPLMGTNVAYFFTRIRRGNPSVLIRSQSFSTLVG